MAAISKTFKLDQKTIDELQGILDTTGLTWDGTFALLASQYQAQTAAASVGRATEMQEFTTLLSKVSEAYASALAINADTDARIRAEYDARITSYETTLASLKDELTAAEASVKVAQDQARDAERDAKVAQAETAASTKRAEDAESKVEALQSALNDKAALNEGLAAQLTASQEHAAELTEQVKAADATAESKLETLRDAHKQEIQQMKDRLTELQRDHAQEIERLKGRFEERTEIAAGKAQNELAAAVLKAKQEADAKLDAFRDEIAKLKDKLRKQQGQA